MTSEKQASIDELSSTIAHEIRNPIAAAKSLVQQMGEDPTSPENVEYGKVALEELERVERSISHLLKYAKEEDYTLGARQPRDGRRLRAHADARQARRRARARGAELHLRADRHRRRREAPPGVRRTCSTTRSTPSRRSPKGRRIELYIENGRPDQATVRVRRQRRAASPPTRSDASSIRSSRPRRRARASAWRSPGRSSRRTRDDRGGERSRTRHRVHDPPAAAREGLTDVGTRPHRRRREGHAARAAEPSRQGRLRGRHGRERRRGAARASSREASTW